MKLTREEIEKIKADNRRSFDDWDLLIDHAEATLEEPITQIDFNAQVLENQARHLLIQEQSAKRNQEVVARQLELQAEAVKAVEFFTKPDPEKPTLRDEFAMAVNVSHEAIAGALKASNIPPTLISLAEADADYRYLVADAMLAARREAK